MLLGLSDPFQLGEAASGVPVLDVEVSIFVKAKSVRCGKDARLLFSGWNPKISPLSFFWVITDYGYNFTFFVNNG